MRHRALAALAALALAACPGDPSQRVPAGSDDGVQMTGRLGGDAITVSDGEPEVTYGDCDPATGEDVDLCVVSFTVDGAPIGFVIENPDALVAGAQLDVVRRACRAGCDDLTDAVVVEVRQGERHTIAEGGRVTIDEAGERYAGSFELRFANGQVTGSFNVAPPVTP